MARKDSRLFARLALDYADHPKIVVLSDAAFRAHIEMILYAARYQTDGRVPKQIAKRWPEHALQELLANDIDAPSLVRLSDGDFVLHGYADMQETKAEIEKKRLVRAENGRNGGLAKAKACAKQTLKQNGSKNVADIDRDIDIETTPKGVEAAQKRGTRIPEPFEITSDMVAWARERCPLVDGQNATERFVNHFTAKTGRDATKLDWLRTWKNWLLQDQETAERHGVKPSKDDRAMSVIEMARSMQGQQRLEVGA